MKRCRIRKSAKVLIGVLLTLMSAPLLMSNAAHGATSYVYDNFNGSAIDTTNWTVNNGQFFTESGGTLNFSASANGGLNQGGSLVSPRRFLGFVDAVLTFSGFESTNTETSGSGPWNGVLQFRLWENASNYVSIYRGHNYYGDFFQVGSTDNGITKNNAPIWAGTASGMLGFFMVGSSIQARYDAGAGWVDLGSAIDVSDWTLAPGFSVIGGSGFSGETSFHVDSVSYSSVPLPPSLLLLAPGLVALAGTKRRLKK